MNKHTHDKTSTKSPVICTQKNKQEMEQTFYNKGPMISIFLIYSSYSYYPSILL